MSSGSTSIRFRWPTTHHVSSSLILWDVSQRKTYVDSVWFPSYESGDDSLPSASLQRPSERRYIGTDIQGRLGNYEEAKAVSYNGGKIQQGARLLAELFEGLLVIDVTCEFSLTYNRVDQRGSGAR